MSDGTETADAGRRDLRRAAQMAEWDVPAGRLGGLVRQQRHRARVAGRRAGWLLAVLILVVVLGLGYYVGLPIWQKVQDASKREHEARARFLTEQLTQMDAARNAAWTPIVDALRHTLTPIELPEFDPDATEVFTPAGGTRLIVTGRNGLITFSDDAGQSWTRAIRPGGPSELFDAGGFGAVQEVGPDGRLLIFTMVPERGGGPFLDPSFPALYSDDRGASWTVSEGLADRPRLLGYRNRSPEGETLLVVTERGLAVSTDAGASWTEPLTGEGIGPDLYVDRRDGVYFALGANGLLASSADGVTWTRIPTGVTGLINAVQAPESGVLAISYYLNNDPQDRDEIRFRQSTDGGTTWTDFEGRQFYDMEQPIIVDPLPFVQEVQLGDRRFDIEESDFGLQVSLRTEADAEPQPVHQERSIQFLNDILVDDAAAGEFLAIGRDSRSLTVLFGTLDGGDSWQIFATADALTVDQVLNNRLAGFARARTQAAFAVYLPGKAMVRLDNRYHGPLAALVPEPGSDGDDAMLRALDQLSRGLRADAIVAPLIAALTDSITDRDPLETERDTALSQADEIAGSGFSPAERRRDFEDFLAACSPDGTQTAACTEAYVALRASETRNVWEIVAERAPQAVLLLFLLATLGGLYRYNLRLSGFHHSRADALELASTTGRFTSDMLTALADALAADKVEFGKASTPADQAVEMFKAVMARTK